MAATLNDESREFYRKLIRVGIPVLIQQLISMGLNLADTIMVGKVSAEALAAVGAANQVYFIYSVVIFGVFSGAAVHAVQHWGIGDLVTLRRIVGIDYVMGFALGIFTTLLAYFAAPGLVSLFTAEANVIEMGSSYLRIACFSYLFAGLTFVITYNSRSIMDLKIPTTINGIAIGLNIFLNYVLIYGHFGMPALGVRGAAFATLTARILECVAMLTSVYVRKSGYPLRAKPKELFSFSMQLYKKVMITAVPVIFTEGLWAVSVSLTYAAYGKISAAALAVVQITGTVTDLFQTIYFGVGNAASVIIGQALGQGRLELAFRHSRRVMKITWVLNIVMTALIILMRTPVANIYDFDAGTTDLLMKGLLVYAIAMTPKMLAYMMICAILRAGDDNVYCLTVDASMNMLVQVPLAFISVLVFNLTLPLAMAVVTIPDFIKVFLCYKRYYSRKWMNVITNVEERE